MLSGACLGSSLRDSQDEIKNAITELQSQMEATVARIDEAERESVI